MLGEWPQLCRTHTAALAASVHDYQYIFNVSILIRNAITLLVCVHRHALPLRLCLECRHGDACMERRRTGESGTLAAGPAFPSPFLRPPRDLAGAIGQGGLQVTRDKEDCKCFRLFKCRTKLSQMLNVHYESDLTHAHTQVCLHPQYACTRIINKICFACV